MGVNQTKEYGRQRFREIIVRGTATFGREADPSAAVGKAVADDVKEGYDTDTLEKDSDDDAPTVDANHLGHRWTGRCRECRWKIDDYMYDSLNQCPVAQCEWCGVGPFCDIECFNDHALDCDYAPARTAPASDVPPATDVSPGAAHDDVTDGSDAESDAETATAQASVSSVAN
jgi:hypothetical protein